MFMPNSRFRNSWDIFIFVVIVYNSIVTVGAAVPTLSAQTISPANTPPSPSPTLPLCPPLQPLRISILTYLTDASSPIVLADYFFDAIFVVDTVLQFYLPFIDEATGTVVTDPKVRYCLVKARAAPNPS